jgi:site-specific DNA-cytosine methylase
MKRRQLVVHPTLTGAIDRQGSSKEFIKSCEVVNKSTSKIRRLTPKECERLQGFPDDWTKYGEFDGAVKRISDTQRYKMCGNAVTINVIEAIIQSSL